MLKRTLRFQGKFLFFIFDLLMLTLFLGLVSYFRFSEVRWHLIFDPKYWFISLNLVASLYIFGGYDLDLSQEARKLISKISLAFLGSVFASIFLYYVSNQDRSGLFGRGILFGTLISFFIFTLIFRLVVNSYYKNRAGDDHWLFVVSENYLEPLKKDIHKMGLSGHKTFLLENSDLALRLEKKSDFEKYDSIKNIEKYLNKNWFSIVVALEDSEVSSHAMSSVLMKARFSGHRILSLNHFYEDFFGKLPVYFLSDNWFVLTEGFSLIHNPVGLRIKRVLDIIISLILLGLTWPLMILVALLIKIETRGSVIYSQIRTGLNGTSFKIYKFRSMFTNAEVNGKAEWAKKNDNRVTMVGKFIRKTRLDELPQLINILKGEMSFVGPRPERPEFNSELQKEIPFYNLRHLVNPGLTGWAQVIYPYGSSLEDSREKLQYELYYIKHYSLLMDVIIVLKTISVVLLGRGR